MSIPEYKDGKYIASWDFECPLCAAMWNNEGDNMEQDEQEEAECPKCGAELLITAEWEVNYTVNIATPAAQPAQKQGEDRG